MINPPAPNFFVVGAPRCGTTSMHGYLSQHPDVFMPPEKEIHFFGRDLDPALLERRAAHLGEYLALFAEAGSRRCIGEASPLYLYSESAPAEIAAFCPDARIVIMLRDPVDLVYSYYCSWRLAGVRSAVRERTESFEAALNSDLPISYRRLAALAPNVARYLATFGRPRVHVIWFEDLARDPAQVFDDLCRFLGLDTLCRPAFEVQNRSYHVPSPTLMRLLTETPPLVRRAARAVLPARVRRTLRRALLSRAVTQPPAIDPAVRAQLRREFAGDIRQLECLLDVDLNHWLPQR